LEVKRHRARPAVDYVLLSGRRKLHDDASAPRSPVPKGPKVGRKRPRDEESDEEKDSAAEEPSRGVARPRGVKPPPPTKPAPQPKAAAPPRKPAPPPRKPAPQRKVSPPPRKPAEGGGGGGKGSSRYTRAELEGMPVVEVLAIMATFGVSALACMDKADMVAALLRHVV
jgi:hypothetical protein